MNAEELKALFDQQAPGYDNQWARMAPLRDCLHYLLQGVLATLPAQARVLCVGAGTGAEIAFLARHNPGWRFTAVDPSPVMIEMCRQRALSEGYDERCEYHAGYLDALAESPPHDAATCFLVSQFLLDTGARTDFFRGIAARLQPRGILASSDLAADVRSTPYAELLPVWFGLIASTGMTPEALERMRTAYERDVGVLPPAQVESLIAAAGFSQPVPFFQGGLIHAWFSHRA